MKKLIIILLYTFFLTTIMSSQDLSLHLNIISLELNKIEPLFYELELSNNSEVLKEVDYPWSTVYTPLLEFYNEESNEWEELRYSSFISNYRFNLWKNGVPNSKEKLYLKPNEKISNSLVYLGVDGDFFSTNYILEGRDSIIIRAVFQPNGENSKIIHSNINTIIFTNYLGQDSLALDYLQNLSVPHFIYEKIVCDNSFMGHNRVRIGFNPTEVDNYLIDSFPKSKFAVWAYIDLVWDNIEFIGRVKGLDKQKSIVINSEKFLSKALAMSDATSRPYIKQLFNSVFHLKFSLGFYTDNSTQFFRDIEYIDSL